MALIMLILIPLLAGLALVSLGQGLRPRAALDVSLSAALVTAGLAVGAAITRPSFDRAWLPELDVRTRLVLDGISIPLVLLTAAVGIIVTLHARSELPDGGSPATFLGCLLVVEGGALATFLAGDAVLFFVAFELVLVPMWVLITRFGDPRRPRARTEAGHRFILYTAVGSTLMLIGILLLVTSAGTSNLTDLMAAGAALPAGRQLTIALLLTIGLCVKVPAFPLHTWLPSAHTIAPTAGSVLLAAVLLKMGTYGLVRLPVATVPGGFAAIAPWVGLAGVIGIIWGSLVCLAERDLKRLIAYSSVAHMGFVLLGISTGTEVGLQAALYGNLAHGVISALLFVVVGGLKRRWGVVDLGTLLPALREIAPRRGFFLILGLAAALGLPGLAGFWGEFLAVVAAWVPADSAQIGFFRTYAVLAAVGGVLAAAYCLRVARALWVGDAIPGLQSRGGGLRPSPARWGGGGGRSTGGGGRSTGGGGRSTGGGGRSTGGGGRSTGGGGRAWRRARAEPRRGDARDGAGRARDPVDRRRRARSGAVVRDGPDASRDRSHRRGSPMTTAQNITFDWLRLAPALAPAIGALLVLVVDAVLPGRRLPHLVIATLALLGGASAAVPGALSRTDRPVLSLCLPGGEAGACLWVAGPVASTLQIGILASTLAILLLMVDRWPSLDARASGTRRTHDAAVDMALLLGSAAGGAAVAAARDLATWLIALELATVPVVALVALRGTRRAAHGAMSLLMTSLLSFALLVVGAGLWLVATGDPTFTGMGFTAAWMDPARRGVLVLAALTLLAGLGFKLSLIPFHAWTPPTFATAPLPITALLAATSKIAALAALLVVLTPFARVIEGTPRPHALAFGIGTLAAVSFLIGTVVAFRATDAVRLLAWSTIAQAGWVVLPLAALTASAHRAAAGYVLTYAAASLVAFAAVSAVRATTDGEPGSRRELTAYKGLVRTHPHIGGPLVLALLVLAGLPPGILGLVAKVVALRPLLEAGLWPLAVVAVIGVVVGIAVYLRWIALLLAAPDAQPQARPAVHAGPGALVVLAIGTALLIVASVVPQVLYGLLS